MAFNPMAMLKMRERFSIFRREHPKIVPFFTAVHEHALREGTVLEMKAVTPEGQEIRANMKITENDLETIRMLTEAQDRAE